MAGGRRRSIRIKTRRIGDFTGNDKRATIDHATATSTKEKGRLATPLSAQDQHHQAAGITFPVETPGPVGPFGFGDPPTGSTETANTGYAFTEAALNRAVPPAGSTPSETGCPSFGRPQSCMDLSEGSDEPLKRRT